METMTTRAIFAEKIKVLRAELEERHTAGGGGFDVCRAWAGSTDAVIKELFAELAPESASLPFSLVALGGYGREELNPSSDIDLLFLYDKEISNAEGALPGKVIPMMWDLGFKVGHATRTIADCIRIAQTDLISKTGMLEARFLFGDKAVFGRFEYQFAKNVMAKQSERFVRDKWVESEIRHGKWHNTLLLTEPDVKESPGALRDYHTALWVAAARYGVRGITEIAGRGLMDAEEQKAVTEAVDFILRLRNDIHFLAKGPHNLLDYALQPRVAKRLGFTGEGDTPVIRMMHDYYRAADTVLRFGQSVRAQAMRYRTKTQMFFLKLRHKMLAPHIFAGEDEIFVKDLTAAELAATPETLFTLLRLMVEKELGPSPGLRRMLDEVGRLWKQERPNPVALGVGLRGILEMQDPVKALELMRDCKLITAVIPEFHAIRYLTPFDLYHRFTVDGHSFRAILEFDNLKRNERPECDLLRALYIAEPRKDLVRLALLLHDLGKGTGGHHEERIDPAILLRIGFSEEEAATVERLVRQHLLMNSVAQKRDIHEPHTVIEFAEQVGDDETLKRLYMLTYADTCAVGPGIWNSWKGALLKELFTLGATYFEGKDPLQWFAPGRFLPPEKMTPEVIRFIKGMPDKYFFMRSPEEVERDAALFTTFMMGDGAPLIQHRYISATDPGELTLVSKNKLGLLYNALGTLASKNIDILQAIILTHGEGVAFDFFRVHGPNGQPIGDDAFWGRVEGEIRRVLAGEKTVDEILKGRTRIIGGQNAVMVDPHVRVLNDVSFSHTVVETVSRDRIGLLFDSARAISDAGLDIVSASIAVEGHKALNTFYVSEADGKKVTNPERMEEIKEALKAALIPPA